ncbi:Leucine-rich repeat domain superfamily [Sesbania bispinosa]|nr:Leucine-rich repeat domain superfamily [Sesbania bispinosa]
MALKGPCRHPPYNLTDNTASTCLEQEQLEISQGKEAGELLQWQDVQKLKSMVKLTALPKLQTLLLDQNQLTGPLPSDKISWKSLVILDLSQNQLSGQIPDAIGSSEPYLVQLCHSKFKQGLILVSCFDYRPGGCSPHNGFVGITIDYQTLQKKKVRIG